MTTVPANGKAATVRKIFSRQTTVSIAIHADLAVIWALLTNASDYPRWNSTILAIEGTIAKGERIRLTSTLAPKKQFKLKVLEADSPYRLAWGDAMGTREYNLQADGDNLVRFTMQEKIAGPLFPLFAKLIPPFDQAFEQFAADLKKEAELIMKTK